MKHAFSIVLLATLLIPIPAGASLFGEENVTLASLLAQSLQQTATLKETLSFARETAAYARETALFARASIRAGDDIRALIARPGAFATYAHDTWRQAFPDLTEILRDVDTTRGVLEEVTHPERPRTGGGASLPGAANALWERANRPLEAWAHGVDTWNTRAPHDAALGVLAEEHRLAIDNLAELHTRAKDRTLSPLIASLFTAQAGALSAAANVQAAATLERLARNDDLRLAQEAQAAAGLEKGYHEASRTLLAPRTASWRLDPIGRRAHTREVRR